jgi:Cu+-exporting ATPase
LHWAASLEQSSEHPLGHALLKAARERGLKLSAVTQFVATPGAGVRGTVAGRAIAVGKWTFVASATKDTTSPPPDPADSATGAAARSVIYLAMEGVPSAAFFIEDRIRPSATSALASLRRLGVDIQMMTGDNARVAGRVAHQLGIEHYRSEVSPRDKHDHVQKLKTAGRVVAMAGDGINDAPALAAADVGMAMGTGTDIAMQSAGVTLLRGNLDGIAKAIRLSHLTMRNIRQNLFFAFAYNALGIPLAAGILVPLLGDSWRLNPMLAALAMSLSSVSVIANALRLQRANLRS